MRLKALFGLLCALLLASTPSVAHAVSSFDERITNFNVEMVIGVDGRVDVREQITVTVEGINIKRGIYRDIPTRYKGPNGTNVSIGFDVQGVTMDGQPIPWSVGSIGAGKRIKIGDADRFLPHGVHSFDIRYTTDRTLLFFEDNDALYWNVTGTGWNFAIDHVRVTVTLPGGVRVTDAFAFVGRAGTSATISSSSGNGLDFVTVQTNRALDAGEGLTLAVEWPAGFVERPTALDEKKQFFSDNAVILIGLAGTMLLLGFFIAIWREFGRDNRTKAIIPEYEPPAGMGPALCRYVSKMAYDETSISAALVSMAQKGYLSIHQDGSTITLYKEDAETSLTHAEKAFSKALFGQKSQVILGAEYVEEVGEAVEVFKAALKNNEQAYFLRNSGLTLLGDAIAVVAILAMFVTNLAIGLSVIAALAIYSYYIVRSVKKVGSSSVKWSYKLQIPLVVLVVITFKFFGGSLSVYMILFAGIDIAIALLFLFLMKAPTEYGRTMMNHIDGFKLYLGVAEKDRMNFHNPPERTPEVYEKYLPYAIALGVEHEWGEQFDAVLKQAAALQGKEEYYPIWYHGHMHHGIFGHRSFSENLSNTMGTAISTATVAPSTSGGFSGGSVGGGFGGGGGGGW